MVAGRLFKVDASTRERFNAIFAAIDDDLALADLPMPSRLKNALLCQGLTTSSDVQAYISRWPDAYYALVLLPNVGVYTITQLVENHGIGRGRKAAQTSCFDPAPLIECKRPNK